MRTRTDDSSDNMDRVELFLGPNLSAQIEARFLLWNVDILQRFEKLDMIMRLHMRQILERRLMFPNVCATFNMSSLVNFFMNAETTIPS